MLLRVRIIKRSCITNKMVPLLSIICTEHLDNSYSQLFAPSFFIICTLNNWYFRYFKLFCLVSWSLNYLGFTELKFFADVQLCLLCERINEILFVCTTEYGSGLWCHSFLISDRLNRQWVSTTNSQRSGS